MNAMLWVTTETNISGRFEMWQVENGKFLVSFNRLRNIYPVIAWFVVGQDKIYTVKLIHIYGSLSCQRFTV